MIAVAPIDQNIIDDPAHPPSIHADGMSGNVSAKITSWAASTDATFASGAVSIVDTQGMGRRQSSATMAGALGLLGSSELTEYPIMSTAWNQIEPIVRQANDITIENYRR